MAVMDPIGGMLALSRDGIEYGDERIVFVSERVTRTAHMATVTGGKCLPLSRPTLAVYVDGELYPAEWRSLEHDPERGSVKLLVELERNDPFVHAVVLARTAQFKPNRRYLRQQAKRNALCDPSRGGPRPSRTVPRMASSITQEGSR
jgi:hypothetical protein